MVVVVVVLQKRRVQLVPSAGRGHQFLLRGLLLALERRRLHGPRRVVATAAAVHLAHVAHDHPVPDLVHAGPLRRRVRTRSGGR